MEDSFPLGRTNFLEAFSSEHMAHKAAAGSIASGSKHTVRREAASIGDEGSNGDLSTSRDTPS
eukprot:6991721-Prorocentrum_lima.AAC.1